MRPFSAETETVQVPAVTSAAGTMMRSTLLAESRRQESLLPEHFPSLRWLRKDRWTVRARTGEGLGRGQENNGDGLLPAYKKIMKTRTELGGNWRRVLSVFG